MYIHIQFGFVYVVQGGEKSEGSAAAGSHTYVYSRMYV